MDASRHDRAVPMLQFCLSLPLSDELLLFLLPLSKWAERDGRDVVGALFFVSATRRHLLHAVARALGKGS